MCFISDKIGQILWGSSIKIHAKTYIINFMRKIWELRDIPNQGNDHEDYSYHFLRIIDDRHLKIDPCMKRAL